MPKNYWLIKEEPTKYSYDNLVDDKKTIWDGVGNNLALKNIRNISNIYPNILQICATNIPNMSQQYANNMSNMCQDIFQACPKNVQTCFRDIKYKYVLNILQNMPNIFPTLPQHHPNIIPKSSQNNQKHVTTSS